MPLRKSRWTRSATTLGAAVGLEAVEVEPERRDPLPEVRVVDAAAIGEQRIPEAPERFLRLERRRLACRVQGRRARALAGEREVADAEPQRQR